MTSFADNILRPRVLSFLTLRGRFVDALDDENKKNIFFSQNKSIFGFFSVYYSVDRFFSRILKMLEVFYA